MAACPSSDCAICYRTLTNARLLGCLHSFCKTCLDDLDIHTGHAHEISCPVCRLKTRLPDSGATGLPKDVTVKVDQHCDCQKCKENGRETKAELWCTACAVGFCKEHGVAHLMANSGHVIKPLGEARVGEEGSRTSAVSRYCPGHELPLQYFCKQCNKAVCGGCTAVGDHHGHKPIVSVKEIAKDLKQRVSRKINKLKTARLARVQAALSDVGKVTTELSLRAEQVRTDIRSSRKCVLDAVELLFEQKLAEVDDLEETRLKHLGSQEDELKLAAQGLESVIKFAGKVLGVDVEADVSDVLLTVDKRADELERAELEAQPVEHSCLGFQAVHEDELLTRATALVGEVLPFYASAMRSVVEGDTKKTGFEGSPVSFEVVAKDKFDRCLAKGGDSVRAEVCQTAAEGGRSPSIDVLDKKNGTYMSSVTAQRSGEYSFDVFVNNVKLHKRLSISCHQPARFTFDPAECQGASTISGDQLTVTHTGRNETFSSVLSRHGMSSGQHVWKVSIADKKRGMNGMWLGVAEKLGLTAKTQNWKYMYGWCGYDGKEYILGVGSKGMRRWEDNDVLQFHLNCTKRTLTITNLRSAEIDTISNLPPTELFAYFHTYLNGQSFTLLPGKQ